LTDSRHGELVCDVAISGGGMVGCALGCALAQQGLRVALIEQKEPQRDWPAEEVDLRVSALSRASQVMLENLGVWEAMGRMRVSPYRRMQVWDAVGKGSIEFDASEIGEPDLGHIVENRVTRLALWDRLGEFDNLVSLCPDRVVQISLEQDGARLELMSGRNLRAGLLVGAEGALSPVRDMAGITSSGWDYDRAAGTTTSTRSSPPSGLNSITNPWRDSDSCLPAPWPCFPSMTGAVPSSGPRLPTRRIV